LIENGVQKEIENVSIFFFLFLKGSIKNLIGPVAILMLSVEVVVISCLK
jgi:hypothetical protein